VAKTDARDAIAAKFVDALAQGIVPWRKPWRGGNMTPRNPVTGTIYKGGNALYLGLVQAMAGYSSGEWFTFKNAQAKGGNVKKGEKGSAIVFWSFIEKVNAKNGKKEKIPFIRSSVVFNRDQCEGLPTAEIVPSEIVPIVEAQRIADGMPNAPRVTHSADTEGAFYVPSQDAVTMPNIERFINAESYYATLYHELAHSTGHDSRLKREGVSVAFNRTKESYSKEELIAEITSAFLCAEAGILDKVEENSIAYVTGWASKLQSEPRMILEAANSAQKAADYILGVKAAEAAPSED
jgi:antirestriction protein ArdC